LAEVMRNVEGVDMVIQHEAAFGVVHDFWLPSMTTSIPLGWQYKDIDGSAYLKRPAVNKGAKLRIGLRWQGNPQFEHEQHRVFPASMMFNAVKGLDVEYVSLQRDELVEETRSGFFAEDDAPLGAERDLEDRAGVNAERVADLLRQGELAFGGDGGFHGLTVK
jgi:hypothetical protein